MKKKGLSLALALFLLISLLAGCSGGSAPPVSTSGTGSQAAAPSEAAPPEAGSAGASATEESVTLRLLMPGEASPRMQELAQNELNAKLKEDLNCVAEFIYSPWSDYWNTVNMELAAGQPYDLFWDHNMYFGSRVAMKAYTPLTDLLEQYGAGLKNAISQEQFDAYTVDGQLLSLPMNEDPAGMFRSVCVRQDILEEIGMSAIKTKEDLFRYLEEGKALYPDMDGIAGSLAWVLSKYGLSDSTITHTGTSDVAFVVEEEDGSKIHSWFESEEFKECCEIMHDLYQKGLVAEWALTNLGDAYVKFSAGTLLMYRGTGGTTALSNQTIRAETGDSGATMWEYNMYSDKPMYFTTASGNLFSIPASAENPERAMMLVDWMVKSQDNYDLVVYGIKGQDYTLEGDAVKRNITDELFPGWMLPNGMGRYNTEDSPEAIEAVKHWSDGAKYSKLFGFTFDAASVEAENAKIAAVAQEAFSPMQGGYVRWEDYYDNAISELKKAGLDDYLAEMQRQFDEFHASKA